MTIDVKDGGSWKSVKQLFVKNGGVWKEIQEAYVKENGVWKQFYAPPVETVDILVSIWGGKGKTTSNGGGAAFGGKTDLLCKAPLDATFSWYLGSGDYENPDGCPGFKIGRAHV